MVKFMKKSIKIMYLIPHLENTGPVSQLYSLIKYLNRDAFEPIIVTFYDERVNSLIDDFTKLRVKIYQIHSNHFQLFFQKREIKKIIRKVNPDIIHSNSVFTDVVAKEIKQQSIPLILTIHNFIYDDLIPRYGSLIGRILCLLEKQAIYKADIVITCSKTLKDKYEKIIPRKYIAIQNGIEIEKWQIKNVDKNILRNKLGIPVNKFVFLSSGRLIKRKDPITIIEAFKKLNNKNVYLVMLGNGSSENDCKKIADNDPNIKFTGRVNNVKDYLYAADVLISASLSEGLPYAILEAEATGIKMILSNISSHREVIQNNLEDVFLFKTKDVKQLTESMYCCCLKQNQSKITYHMDQFSAQYMSNQFQKTYLSEL